MQEDDLTEFKMVLQPANVGGEWGGGGRIRRETQLCL